MEWPQEEDEFDFGFAVLDRMLAGEESSNGDADYYKTELPPVDYTILNYGICK